ncbi:phospholipid/cholesterol/gamma-HCH transport system ATP-binding protein [Hydrogenispora ethanolica]|uniref:Phospholipid/cholesterol/gamma-HCH transport system ATP-binding protein n=1 Tax=Hydrogenispora ethanolica TaxID=1082276 RepID=A0A4R1RXZ1_HYDET|nr:ATP-binding cassette domain-containing protein [Hydrogenispora ethanolica]TCL71621.1 phospholipid/cholesterol/gamma-HCH transport system ATP-binding protein [Hydrogenispora ethanolica]
MIKLVNLSYAIGGRMILQQLNLTVERGETLVIMGPSGCGKSTLLRLIMGLIQPTAGWVEIDGTGTAAFTKEEWREIRQQMGMVFQSSALFDSLNIYDNVAFGLRRKGLPEAEIRERVYRTLAIVGLEPETAAKMPADLSGGMKKRTAIARAVAIEPPILLYDEPTTGLDPIIADTINELIRELQRNLGITSIVVTHDIQSALKVADRVGLLNEGDLVEVRPRAELDRVSHPLFRQFLQNFRLEI